jgi:hypothetical protein
MTTRLVIAYGLLALLVALGVVLAIWVRYHSRSRADARRRRRNLAAYANRQAAQNAVKVPNLL